MIISEKQIHILINIANMYVRLLNELELSEPSLIMDEDKKNKLFICNLIQKIQDQQSDELKVIE